tara:strand:- start:251 stop:457 length:207 start_codon:yes stop_codon:yes gene_type:complete
VAQLNSAPDYGSGGCKFESCRGHSSGELVDVNWFSVFLIFAKTLENKVIEEKIECTLLLFQRNGFSYL